MHIGKGKYIMLRLFLVFLIFHCDGMAGKRRVITAAVISGIKLIERLTCFRIEGTGIPLIGKAGGIGCDQAVVSVVRCQVYVGAFLAVLCRLIGFVVLGRGVCSCVKKPQPGAVAFSLMQSIVDSVGLCRVCTPVSKDIHICCNGHIQRRIRCFVPGTHIKPAAEGIRKPAYR